ncbi:MAG: hypothetical protein CVU88_08615 [Firmicutes bacterium HGW-Firmicutes-13]|nr:MAG: hypothetical protein CVU88_08615 [Firmicutes bacterium HGW-Firmicutes-13]
MTRLKNKHKKEIPIKMVRGILAFEDILDYTLTTVADNPCFFWLEGGEEGPDFLLTKPGFFFEDYKIELKREEIQDLSPESGEIEAYVIITVPEKTTDMTANLLGPLLINKEKGLARQVVLQDTPYTTRHYLFPPEKRRNCG